MAGCRKRPLGSRPLEPKLDINVKLWKNQGCVSGGRILAHFHRDAWMLPEFTDDGLPPSGDYELTFEQLKQSMLVVGPGRNYPDWHLSWRTAVGLLPRDPGKTTLASGHDRVDLHRRVFRRGSKSPARHRRVFLLRRPGVPVGSAGEDVESARPSPGLELGSQEPETGRSRTHAVSAQTSVLCGFVPEHRAGNWRVR